MNNNNDIHIIEEEINEIVHESVGESNGGFTFVEFLDTFDIFEFTISTLIGFTSATVIREITQEILFPITKRLFFHNASDKMEIYGAEFDIRKIVSNIIFLIVFVTSIYLFFRLIFKEPINKAIKHKKKQYHQNRLVELYKIQLLKENNELMKKYFGR